MKSPSKPGRVAFVALISVLTLAIAFYVGSYLSLASGGRYEPGTIGLNGVKQYEWAPQGFVTDYKWNVSMRQKYAPLYWFDKRFWHESDDAYSGNYPVNWVPIERIGEVYQAWK